MEYQAVPYQTPAGKKPFDEWLDKLRQRDRVAAASVDARLARIRDKMGLNLSDQQLLKSGKYRARKDAAAQG